MGASPRSLEGCEGGGGLAPEELAPPGGGGSGGPAPQRPPTAEGGGNEPGAHSEATLAAELPGRAFGAIGASGRGCFTGLLGPEDRALSMSEAGRLSLLTADTGSVSSVSRGS